MVLRNGEALMTVAGTIEYGELAEDPTLCILVIKDDGIAAVGQLAEAAGPREEDIVRQGAENRGAVSLSKISNTKLLD